MLSRSVEADDAESGEALVGITGQPSFSSRKEILRLLPIVHSFTIWDHFAGRRIMPIVKLPIERIQEIGGEVVPYTALEIDESELDDDGGYVPATPQSAEEEDRN